MKAREVRVYRGSGMLVQGLGLEVWDMQSQGAADTSDAWCL